jgi:hypothetical protein
MASGLNVSFSNPITQDAEDKKHRTPNRRCSPLTSEEVRIEGMTADDSYTAWTVTWGILLALLVVCIVVIIVLVLKMRKQGITLQLMQAPPAAATVPGAQGSYWF